MSHRDVCASRSHAPPYRRRRGFARSNRSLVNGEPCAAAVRRGLPMGAGLSPTPSRLLKKSVAFGDEARVVAFVDIEMADETAGGAAVHPTAAADGIAFVVALPGELRAGR